MDTISGPPIPFAVSNDCASVANYGSSIRVGLRPHGWPIDTSHRGRGPTTQFSPTWPARYSAKEATSSTLLITPSTSTHCAAPLLLSLPRQSRRSPMLTSRTSTSWSRRFGDTEGWQENLALGSRCRRIPVCRNGSCGRYTWSPAPSSDQGGSGSTRTSSYGLTVDFATQRADRALPSSWPRQEAPHRLALNWRRGLTNAHQLLS